MTFHYGTKWDLYGLFRRIKPASSSMAVADAALSADLSVPRQLATPQTWTAGRHLGLDARMAFDGTGWLERAVLTRTSAGRYRLDTAEAALAQVLKPETTDCRRSVLEHGFCPAPASGFGKAGSARLCPGRMG